MYKKGDIHQSSNLTICLRLLPFSDCGHSRLTYSDITFINYYSLLRPDIWGIFIFPSQNNVMCGTVAVTSPNPV